MSSFAFAVLGFVVGSLVVLGAMSKATEHREEEQRHRKEVKDLVDQRSDIQWAFVDYIRGGSENPARHCKKADECQYCRNGYCIPPQNDVKSKEQCEFLPKSAPDITVEDYEYWY